MHVARSRLISLVLIGFFGVLPLASASTGSAVLPHWRVMYYAGFPFQGPSFVHTRVNVSNVSTGDVQVTLRLYDQNGNAIGAMTGLSITTTGGFVSCIGTNSSCTLPAGKSATFDLRNSTTNDTELFGHGTLEWSSTGTDSPSVALVADGDVTYLIAGEGVTRRGLVVTRVQPF